MLIDRLRRAFTSAGRWSDSSLTGSAGTLSYKVYESRRAGGPRTALVVMLHGCGQTPEDFAAGTRMNEFADRHGLIVLYPGQSAQANPMNCWNWFEAKDQVRDRGEPSLIAAVTRTVAQAHGIGDGRIFVAGLSAGGAMAVILGAAYPDLFAAVGTHSGLPYCAARDASSALSAMRGRSGPHAWAPQERPPAMPTIVFHGDCDTTVDPGNGSAIVEQVLAAAANASGAVQSSLRRESRPAGAPTPPRPTAARTRRHWPSTGSCTAPGMPGPADLRWAPSPTRRDRTPRRRCCGFSWHGQGQIPGSHARNYGYNHYRITGLILPDGHGVSGGC